jgi:hypothetical protein
MVFAEEMPQLYHRRRCWTLGNQRGCPSLSFSKKKTAEAAEAAAGGCAIISASAIQTWDSSHTTPQAALILYFIMRFL